MTEVGVGTVVITPFGTATVVVDLVLSPPVSDAGLLAAPLGVKVATSRVYQTHDSLLPESCEPWDIMVKWITNDSPGRVVL